MSATYELTAAPRERVGKGSARAERRAGRIPAVIYGEKQPPLPISLPYKDVFQRIHAGGFLTTVCTIDLGGDKHRVIPRDYQLDPVRDFLLHVDFLRIGEHSTVTVDVPVHFVNDEASPGIRRGGVLNVVRHTVELECLADAIPDHLVCDLTGLDIGDSLHISAVALPEGTRPTIRDRDFTIATIAAPAGLKEALAEEAAEAEESGAAPAAEDEGE